MADPMHKLLVRVQVDRLPNYSYQSADWVQLGVRVSATFEAEPTSTENAADLAELLRPWDWVDWKPHTQGSWKLGLPKPDGTGKGYKLDEVTFSASAESSGFDSSGFSGVVKSHLKKIVEDGGLRTVLAPSTAAPIAGRTVYGLVESLTMLPAPVPAGMKLWAALSINKKDLPKSSGDN